VRVPGLLIAFALLAGGCAQTSDDAAIARSSTSAWSPIRDDADDASASLARGWSPAPDDRGAWIGDSAEVTLSVTRPGAFDALLEATAVQAPRRVRVAVDGRPIAPPFSIGVEAGPPVVLPIGTLGFGPHQIRFESLDGTAAGSSGTRVSVAVRRLTMERVGG
jgi:hypothetical protein